MTSSQLFDQMPTDLGLEIIEFTHATEKALYKAMLDTVAQARKVRPVFLERQPRIDRNLTLLQSLSRPAMSTAADSLLRAWLLKKHGQLLIDFLEALSIKHEKGMVEELPKTVDDATLRNAVESLLGKHPHAVVAVYLHAFNSMNKENWVNLEILLKEDARLKLAAG